MIGGKKFDRKVIGILVFDRTKKCFILVLRKSENSKQRIFLKNIVKNCLHYLEIKFGDLCFLLKFSSMFIQGHL